MRCGLFGKLPAKRDFVAPNAPRDFLSLWEPWVQGGVAASRLALGENWQAAFLQAPIWRFWLGRELCGGIVLGAMMPSVDGIGRYFPLTLFARAEQGETILSPDLDPQEAWLDGIEEILLSALSPETSLDHLLAALSALGGPATGAPTPPMEVVPLSPAGWATALPEGDVRAGLDRLCRADPGRAAAGSSIWWTLGGGGVAPRALAVPGLPAASLFATLLTGAPSETAPPPSPLAPQADLPEGSPCP
ncbi:type VI secretion system-associated protein TagF [Methylobacterium sp. 37f]|uniref:type VI secretion system-associated protein TagF n=1 Tax=Methylobacterium sp. 37f TaxID=2817058 RepID=UPI001FFD98A3|nr:type VI secretion system-associated protein TagF [Methylobacterium sp. 37f]MCK2056103.1 type VI secretion system-associated protein TagF [Methylobacterium sp. 37f]